MTNKSVSKLCCKYHYVDISSIRYKASDPS